jgi:hypothetical protein
MYVGGDVWGCSVGQENYQNYKVSSWCHVLVQRASPTPSLPASPSLPADCTRHASSSVLDKDNGLKNFEVYSGVVSMVVK